MKTILKQKNLTKYKKKVQRNESFRKKQIKTKLTLKNKNFQSPSTKITYIETKNLSKDNFKL